MKYYLDTEFNGFGGALLTLALAAEDGRELYLGAYDVVTPLDSWVSENVLPVAALASARPLWIAMVGFGPAVADFLEGDADPVIIADWPDDIRYLCAVLITGPGEMVAIPRMTFRVERVDAYPSALPGAVQHNALWDARALRHVLTA